MKRMALVCGWMLLASTAFAAMGGSTVDGQPHMVALPSGDFEMGDHHGFVDPKHGGDETPIHRVHIDSFKMASTHVTVRQYAEFLNAVAANRGIEVRQGLVVGVKDGRLYCDTFDTDSACSISWDGKVFTVRSRADHPMVCVRWEGAIAYCNWLSEQAGLSPSYDLKTGKCDFTQSGFRLPTEAEWEYAARGGKKSPYLVYPYGDEADTTKANMPNSGDPYETGTLPLTTPVGFYNGQLRRKADFHWPGKDETYETGDGANGFGLYDMAGNAWQWCNDWYDSRYYAESPTNDPKGPDRGKAMPDGKAYHCVRGGSWYNGPDGHSRVANRNPAYFRGPKDPDHNWYAIGFRIARNADSENARVVSPNVGPATQAETHGETFVLRSPEVAQDGELPSEFTADGASATLPLEWSGVPKGTKSFAIVMHHIAPDQTKWYWILYNIPANFQSLPKNVKNVGMLGNNSVNERTEYAPPKSKGPGPKTYIYTVYALSAAPQLNVPPERVSRDVLLAAMKDHILGTAELHVVYSRKGDGAETPEDWRPPPPPQGEDRPRREPRPEDNRQGNRPPRDDAGGRAMAENKTPTSPNPSQTVGLFLQKPEAFEGYTLFAPKHNTVTYLMDNQGRVVHQWKSDYEPGQSVYLKPNGNLLHCCFTKNRGFTSGGEGGRVEEFDWDGKLVWEFEYSSDQHLSHHDIAPMPNGNILMLVVEKKSIDECMAAGFNPAMLRDRQLFPDSVIEVQPTYPKGGKVVWEWRVWDHLIQDSDRTKANYGDVAAHPELIDVNCNGRPVPAFWNHMNSIAYNAQLDQIALSVRGCNEIWFLDHSATRNEASLHAGGKHGKGGDLIYRWGNPAAYKRGTARDKQLVQQHDAEWIPDGYPGAGHLTIFNNGYDRGYSSIEEIVPPMDADGHYLLAPGKAYGPDKPIWHYESKNRTDFFSSEISGAHRLPNGNTLICAGVIGHLFEITPTGETVWQYVNPMVRGGILAQGELPGKDMRGHLWNAVFKAHRYSPDYPGLAGRDLEPKEVIELPSSEKGKTGLDQLNEQPREDRDRPHRENQQARPRDN